MITWMKEANNFQKAKVQPKGVRFCFFSQPGVAYKQACSSIEVLMGFINSRSSHRRCSIKIGVLKKFEKFTDSLFLQSCRTPPNDCFCNSVIPIHIIYKPLHFLLQPRILMVAWTFSLKVA